jgi:hypothetical protein
MVLTAALASASPAAAQAPEAGIQVEPVITNAPIDQDTFSVFVTLDGLQHEAHDGSGASAAVSIGLAAFEFSVEFDPDVVDVIGAEPGPGLSETGRRFTCLPPRRERPGHFAFACVSLGRQPGPQGDLTLASLNLKPVGPGSSQLKITASLGGPLGDSIPVSVTHGVARVNGPPMVPETAAEETPAPGDGTSGGSAAPALLTATAVAAEGSGGSGPEGDDGTTGSGELLDGEVRGAGNSAGQPSGDPEAQIDSSGDADEGGGSNAALLWSIVVLGGATACVALGLAGVMLKRRAAP